MSKSLKTIIVAKLNEYNNNSRRVIAFLKAQGLWDNIVNCYPSDGETLYNFMYQSDKTCPQNKVKFRSFSVGYVYCGPASICNCAKNSTAKKVSSTKSKYTNSRQQAINHTRTITNLQRYGIKNQFENTVKIQTAIEQKHGVTNARHIPGVDQQIRKTNLKKYGVDNPSKHPEVKIKQVNTWNANKQQHLQTHRNSLLNKYGVTNARHIPGVDQQIRKTNLKKYGVDNPFKHPDIIQKIKSTNREKFYLNLHNRVTTDVSPLFELDAYKGSTLDYMWKCNICNNTFQRSIINGTSPLCRKCNPNSVSTFEKQVRLFVESIVDPADILYNDRKLIGPYELDIVVPSKKIAIECNGVYWHSELHGKDRYYHLNKSKECEHNGYRLLHIIDDNWYTNNAIVKSIIQSSLGMSAKYYARKCKIIQIEHTASDLFLNTHHIQGSVNSKVNIALEYNNNIVAVMTMGKSRYNKKVEWELLRYSQHTGTTVVGGASRLFAHFIKTYNPGGVISYADRSLFTGNMYKQLGFIMSHYSVPGYSYFSTNNYIGLENRIKYQKHKLANVLTVFDPILTEWKNMQVNNYDRYWNCGNSVWLWQ